MIDIKMTNDGDFDFTRENRMEIHNSVAEPWRVTLVDTGLNTMTGGRVRRVRKYIGDEPFMLTYGDGVSDINIHDLVKFHQSHGKMVTLTAVNVEQRFGVLELGDGDEIRSFREKSIGDRSRINAGYMVCQPEIFDYIAGDETVFEKEPLERVAALGQLVAYKHNGFWQCMDTKREKEKLDALWKSGEAPWNVWKD